MSQLPMVMPTAERFEVIEDIAYRKMGALPSEPIVIIPVGHVVYGYPVDRGTVGTGGYVQNMPPATTAPADVKYFWLKDLNIVVPSSTIFPYPETDVVKHVKSNWLWYVVGAGVLWMTYEAVTSKPTKRKR